MSSAVIVRYHLEVRHALRAATGIDSIPVRQAHFPAPVEPPADVAVTFKRLLRAPEDLAVGDQLGVIGVIRDDRLALAQHGVVRDRLVREGRDALAAPALHRVSALCVAHHHGVACRHGRGERERDPHATDGHAIHRAGRAAHRDRVVRPSGRRVGVEPPVVDQLERRAVDPCRYERRRRPLRRCRRRLAHCHGRDDEQRESCVDEQAPRGHGAPRIVPSRVSVRTKAQRGERAGSRWRPTPRRAGGWLPRVPGSGTRSGMERLASSSPPSTNVHLLTHASQQGHRAIGPPASPHGAASAPSDRRPSRRPLYPHPRRAPAPARDDRDAP